MKRIRQRSLRSGGSGRLKMGTNPDTDHQNDPVMQLLSQWTYQVVQAMVHELLNIQNRYIEIQLVTCARHPARAASGCTISTLSSLHLTLHRKQLMPQMDLFTLQYLSMFGDLRSSLKMYVQLYQSHTLALSAINSIVDMKHFIKEYPKFQKLGGNISKHTMLMGELSWIVGRDQLLEVSEVEQGFAMVSSGGLKVGHHFIVLAVQLLTAHVNRACRHCL